VDNWCLVSKVSISLQRSGCFGTCPFYTVTVSTKGIVFDGDFYVVAQGKHAAVTDGKKVRELANRFVAADFCSMEEKYVASVTNNPTYILSIDIDGHAKKVEDYVERECLPPSPNWNSKWTNLPLLAGGLRAGSGKRSHLCSRLGESRDGEGDFALPTIFCFTYSVLDQFEDNFVIFMILSRCSS